MSGHTPGPWRVKVGPRDDQASCDLSICGDIFMLADIGGPQYAHCYPNAYLMAAAPDLLAALMQIADEQKIYRGHGDYTIEPALSAEEAQAVARAAIAKATQP